MVVVVRETGGLLSVGQRQQIVRRMMAASAQGEGLRAACAFARTTFAEGERLWRGEISKQEFLHAQDAALLQAAEAFAAV